MQVRDHYGKWKRQMAVGNQQMEAQKGDEVGHEEGEEIESKPSFIRLSACLHANQGRSSRCISRVVLSFGFYLDQTRKEEPLPSTYGRNSLQGYEGRPGLGWCSD